MKSTATPILRLNATIHPWGFVFHNTLMNYQDFPKRIIRTPDSKKKENQHNGYLSKNAVRRIKAATNILAFIANDKRLFPNSRDNFQMFKLNCITLTLPSRQVHTDEQIKKLLLDPFLKSCKYHFGMRNYIWKAENQDNDNIHFHLITDTYTDYLQLRTLWNHQLARYGYIESYRLNQLEKHKDGFLQDKRQYKLNKLTHEKENISYSQQKKAYNAGVDCGWTNPNTTDVHMVINVDNLAAYVATYISKKDYWKKERPKEVSTMIEQGSIKGVDCVELVDGYRSYIKKPISGKIWDCSVNLKKCGLLIEDCERFRDEFDWMINNTVEKVIELDYCKVFIRDQTKQRLFPSAIRSLVQSHIEQIKYDCCNLEKYYEQKRIDKSLEELLDSSRVSLQTSQRAKGFQKRGRLLSSRQCSKGFRDKNQTIINFRI